MQTKLTLRLDDRLIGRAKVWAKSRDISLSRVVAGVLSQLSDEGERATLSPWMRSLLGVASQDGIPLSDAELREKYGEYLDAKYR